MRSDKSLFASKDDRYAVSIPQYNLDQMKEQCERFSPLETGGLILGRYSNDGRVAKVLSITNSPRDSEHTQSSFIRGTEGLKELLMRKWKANEYYLGEWHTHPYAPPKPSPRDIRQMKSISSDIRYQCAAPVLVIYCGSFFQNDVDIGVYVVNSEAIKCSLK